MVLTRQTHIQGTAVVDTKNFPSTMGFNSLVFEHLALSGVVYLYIPNNYASVLGAPQTMSCKSFSMHHQLCHFQLLVIAKLHN